MPTTYAIIGDGLAGRSAARAIASATTTPDTRVLLFSEGEPFESRPALFFPLARARDAVPRKAKTGAKKREDAWERRGLCASLAGVFSDAPAVEDETCDAVIVATGATPRTVGVAGAKSLRSAEDVEVLRGALADDGQAVSLGRMCIW